jgi:hypothetical protein
MSKRFLVIPDVRARRPVLRERSGIVGDQSWYAENDPKSSAQHLMCRAAPG